MGRAKCRITVLKQGLSGSVSSGNPIRLPTTYMSKLQLKRNIDVESAGYCEIKYRCGDYVELSGFRRGSRTGRLIADQLLDVRLIAHVRGNRVSSLL